MEKPFLTLFAALLLLAQGGMALAGEEIGSDEQRADWTQRLQKAQALSAEGQAREAAAAKIRAAKDRECPKRFQVNACYRDNLSEYTSASREATRMENEGQAIERQVRKEQLKEKDARNAADAVRRESELAEREAETLRARQAAEDRVAEIRADKAKKAEAGMRRKAEDEEKLRQRQAEHNARVAEKMQKAQEKAGASATGGK